MKEILEIVKAASEEELIRAVKEHGMFASDHEGVAIMEEEIHEAIAEIDTIKMYFEGLKSCVFKDDTADKKRTVNGMVLKHAMLGACELIQVAAMAQKFAAGRKGE